MLMVIPGSSNSDPSAFSPSPVIRQTKPGEASASAFTSSSAASNSAFTGDPRGTRKLATLICAMCQPCIPASDAHVSHETWQAQRQAAAYQPDLRTGAPLVRRATA